jgi:hypothetical protein
MRLGLGDHPEGERKRAYVYGDSWEETHRKWIELADYLAYWLEEVIKPNREEATYSAYSLSSRLYVTPGIGKKQVHKLTVRQTQEWLNKIPGACQCCAQKKDARRKVLRGRGLLR